MAVLAEHVPENNRARFAFEIFDAEFLRPRNDLRIVSPNLAHSSQIAFHIGHENRDTSGAKILRQGLQGYGLTGPGRAGDEAMAVSHFRQEINRFGALSDKDGIVHKKVRHS